MAPENRKARWWLRSFNTKPMLRQGDCANPEAKCCRSGGKLAQAPSTNTPLNAAIAKNGDCQPPKDASHRLKGTPATVDTENDDITTPMARPRRSKGTTSATMVWTSAPNTPPNTPAATRATIKVA